MKIPTQPVRASSPPVRRGGILGLLLFAAAPFGTALAAPGLTTIAIDTSAKPAGAGLVVRHATYENARHGWFEPRSADAAAGPHGDTLDGALSKLDAGDQASFRFSATTAFGDERLMLRSRMHVSRQSRSLRLSQPDPYQAFPEIALAWRLSHDLAIGAEYRFRPDNRNPAGPFGSQARDGAWKDIFLAWSPSSRVSLTASYVDLGRLAPALGGGRQIGHYLAAEFWY